MREVEAVKYYFYALVDPRNNSIQYIGRTVDPKNRMRNHIYESKKERRTKKQKWICKLLDINIEPYMLILFSDVINISQAIEIEHCLVGEYIRINKNLKNSPDNYLGAILTGTKVYQYDLDGQYIQWFHNAHQAYIHTGVKDCNILRCCKNPDGYGTKSAGNYLWSFDSPENYSIYYNKSLNTKPICHFNKFGRLQGNYISAREAEKNTPYTYKQISSYLHGRKPKNGDFFMKSTDIPDALIINSIYRDYYDDE